MYFIRNIVYSKDRYFSVERSLCALEKKGRSFYSFGPSWNVSGAKVWCPQMTENFLLRFLSQASQAGISKP